MIKTDWSMSSSIWLKRQTSKKNLPQGIGADLIATLAGWEREDVDRYALTSQQRAAAAQAEGRFDRSVVAVEIPMASETSEIVKPAKYLSITTLAFSGHCCSN